MVQDNRNEVEKVNVEDIDPFIETEKKIIKLEKDIAQLNTLLKERDITMNKVIATNKRLLTDLNNIPEPEAKKTVSYESAVEDSFYRSLGIKKEK